jgi:TolA-binding protein
MSNNEVGSGGSKMPLINERWQEIQLSIEREKNYRVQSLEDQMSALEERMAHTKAFNQQRIHILAEKIHKSKDQLAQIREKKEEVDHAATKKILSIEESIHK